MRFRQFVEQEQYPSFSAEEIKFIKKYCQSPLNDKDKSFCSLMAKNQITPEKKFQGQAANYAKKWATMKGKFFVKQDPPYKKYTDATPDARTHRVPPQKAAKMANVAQMMANGPADRYVPDQDTLQRINAMLFQ